MGLANMSTSLQVVLFLMCAATALFVFTMIPLSILLYRRAIGFSQQLEELNIELKGLVQDSRTMVQNISAVTVHADEQLDALDSVVAIIRRWSDRADHVADKVSTTVEVPFLKATHSVTAVFQAWRFIVRLVGETLQLTDRQDDGNEETHKC